MAKLLLAPHFPSAHWNTNYSVECLHSYSPYFSVAPRLKKPQSFLRQSRHFSAQAFDADGNEKVTDGSAKPEAIQQGIDDNGSNSSRGDVEKYPSGDFLFEGYDMWETFAVKFKMLIAWPWERVKKGSVLTMKIRGEVSDQLKSRFSSGLSLPQICENFIKAAYDPRISGIYLHIEPLNCGWGKVEEMRRHVLDFKKSG